MKIIIWLAAAMIAAASARAGTGREDVPEETFLELASKPEFECVGVVLRKGSFGGTAVLIDPDHAISAAHVFLDSEIDTVKLEMEGGETIVGFKKINERVTASENVLLVFGIDTVKVTSIDVHPSYLASGRDRSDLVVLTLERQVRSVSAAKMSDIHVKKGTAVMIVGNGPFEHPERNERNYFGRCAGWNLIDSITDDLLICDLDSPTHPKFSITGSPTPHEYEYASVGGDSGGGVFVRDRDDYFLVGVITGGHIGVRKMLDGGLYGMLSEFTRIDAYKDWISSRTK